MVPAFTNALSFLNLSLGLKAFAILFAVFYVVFAFMVWRQTQLMVRTLPTKVAPFLKFIAFFQVGVSLALLSIVIGAF